MNDLREMTSAVLEKARVKPGEKNSQGVTNTSEGTLITPGGNYQNFWIRDYAMSLDTGLISPEEQRHLFCYTAERQADVETLVPSGSRIPEGSIPDRITMDGTPSYFPGWSAWEKQGGWFGKLPAFDNQFFFIHMAWHLICRHGFQDLGRSSINGLRVPERLERAFAIPPTRQGFDSVFCTDDNFGISFGFYDVVPQSGFLLFATVLKHQAATQLREIFEKLGEAEKAGRYEAIAGRISSEIPNLFAGGRGLLRSATGRNSLPDIWASAYGVCHGAITGDCADRISRLLAAAYEQGTLAFRGFIRHVLTTDDFSEDSAWEMTARPYAKGLYQNGGYWSTPTGWVCEAINRSHPDLAKKLAEDFLRELKEDDFRQGEGHGSPWECLHPGKRPQNAIYLTSVSCPLASFEKLGWTGQSAEISPSKW